MATFEVDRLSLPASWDEPLLFRLASANHTVVAEVRRAAALEFTWAPSAPGVASFFASDRMEAFLLDLEEAVGRIHQERPAERMTLDWSDIYPDCA